MLQGFRTYSQTGIVLQVAATPVINVTLAIGSLEETVSVEAAARWSTCRAPASARSSTNERILELPLQGRQVTDLIVLAGAAVQSGVPSARTFPGGVFDFRSPAACPSGSAMCSTARHTTARKAT